MPEGPRDHERFATSPSPTEAPLLPPPPPSPPMEAPPPPPPPPPPVRAPALRRSPFLRLSGANVARLNDLHLERRGGLMYWRLNDWSRQQLSAALDGNSAAASVPEESEASTEAAASGSAAATSPEEEEDAIGSGGVKPRKDKKNYDGSGGADGNSTQAGEEPEVKFPDCETPPGFRWVQIDIV